MTGDSTKPLHKILAVAIIEQLKGVALTVGNCKRYISREILAKNYCIRRNTPISLADWHASVMLAKAMLVEKARAPCARQPPNLAEKARKSLRLLEKLYREGRLTAEEFAQQKSKLQRFLGDIEDTPPFISTGTTGR